MVHGHKHECRSVQAQPTDIRSTSCAFEVKPDPAQYSIYVQYSIINMGFTVPRVAPPSSHRRGSMYLTGSGERPHGQVNQTAFVAQAGAVGNSLLCKGAPGSTTNLTFGPSRAS